MLYIHIPYCKGKCIYCDFYSGGNPDWKKYLKAVASELSERIGTLGGDCLSSIYIGGGTPSLIPPDDFLSFINDIKARIHQAGLGIPKDMEFTMEVNPEDVTEDMALVWEKAGINRVSMGVQSLIDEELSKIKRRHNAEKAEVAMEILKRHFKNISVDIIYGLPGQTVDKLDYTLANILKWRPQHISAYALTFEEGTPLAILRNTGQVEECSEETYIALEHHLIRRLKEAGYKRYEISNFSLPGFQSHHNSGYWEGRPYLGLGPSACSFDGQRVRRSNKANLKAYINGNVEYEEETLSDNELLEEKIMTSLRTAKGLNIDELSESNRKSLLPKASKWIESGHMTFTDNSLTLTEKGFDISDYIILSLV